MSLADFKILNKIGQGAYSSVHKVRRLSDSKEYALKKVRLSLLKDKEKQNSLNQVRILASVQSPYIISYKDAFLQQNNLCIIMQYAQGGDLQAKIKDLQRRHTHLQQPQLWKLISHMLNGLLTLHQMKIMHRDLKSANVFVCGDHYKLGDMNVSKIVKNKLAYTQTGTPYYASPEVWRDEAYDVKSDIWSLGCVVYEVCALKPPFQARDMEGLYRRVQRGVFERIPRVYSQELQKFIQLCLQLLPAKRPDCKQLLAYPSLARFTKSPSQHQNNLLQTIKLPKNLRNLKQHLPKSKYQSDSTSQRQRVHSQNSNSDIANRYRTDNNQNTDVRHMLPPIGRIGQRDRVISSLIQQPSRKYPESQQNLLLKPQELEMESKLRDILREKQKIKELMEINNERRQGREESLPVLLPKKVLRRALPYYVEQKPEEYSRPAWWG